MGADHQHQDNSKDESQQRTLALKLAILVLVGLTTGFVFWQFGDALTLRALAQRESELRSYQAQFPGLVYAVALGVYVLVTATSLPGGATALTLLFGWYFGFAEAFLMVSFASTAGASLAFLVSRFLFHDAIQTRFKDSLQSFNASWSREGKFFLFTMRLVPAVPFFLVNILMALTTIRLRTFWWVSQVGMLPGTAVYVYAGSSVPSLKALADDGIQAVFSPAQIFQIFGCFLLIGMLPFLIRLALKQFSKAA